MSKSIRKAFVVALILAAAFLLAAWGYGSYTGPQQSYYPMTPPYRPYTSPTGIYLRKYADEDNYYLRVQLGNLPAEQLRVDTVQGFLVLQALRIRQSAGGDRFGGFHSRGYQRYNRRIALPFDADAQKMSIQRKEDSVTITIPRWQR